MSYLKELEDLREVVTDAVTIQGKRRRYAEYNIGMPTIYEYWEGIGEMQDWQRESFYSSGRMKVVSLEEGFGLGRNRFLNKAAGLFKGYDALTIYVQERTAEGLVAANQLYIPGQGDPKLTSFSITGGNPQKRLAYERDLRHFYNFFNAVTLWDYQGFEQDMEKINRGVFRPD